MFDTSIFTQDYAAALLDQSFPLGIPCTVARCCELTCVHHLNRSVSGARVKGLILAVYISFFGGLPVLCKHDYAPWRDTVLTDSEFRLELCLCVLQLVPLDFTFEFFFVDRL